MTHSILVYGDSLSWGILPGLRTRLPFEQRWPGVLELGLRAQGVPARVIEDCLNGRRTVYEDPFKAGRNGLVGLAQRMEVNSPLSLIILMLGTNDFQFNQPFVTPWTAAQGVATLVNTMRTAPIEPGMPVPPILIVAPPPIVNPKGPIAPKFVGAEERCVGLAVAYREVAESLGCSFFDAGEIVSVSEVDGIHLDSPEHIKLGTALVQQALSILAKN